MWYDVVLGDAFHDTVIWLDDIAVAITPVGISGGESVVGDCVVAEAGELGAELPALFAALIS
jgi:hypothetical protein